MTASPNSMEEYYQRVIQLQEKLRQSEEERLKLEMKYNETIQTMKVEEEVHFKKLRSKYKQFLEEDRRRQQRNDKILDALERIESRTSVWKAKSEKFKAFKKRYRHFLPPNQIFFDKDLQEDRGDAKKDVIENYLQSISSVKPSESIVQPPETKYSNLGNINSVYWKNPLSEKQDLEKTFDYDFNSTQLKTTKDFENSLKQNTKPIPSPTSTPLTVSDFKGSTYEQHGRVEGPIKTSLDVHSELQRLLKEDRKVDTKTAPYMSQYHPIPRTDSIDNRVRNLNLNEYNNEQLHINEHSQNIQHALKNQPQVDQFEKNSIPPPSKTLQFEKIADGQDLSIPVARKELNTTDKAKPTTENIIPVARQEVIKTRTEKPSEDFQEIRSPISREKYQSADDHEIPKPSIKENFDNHDTDLVQERTNEPQQEINEEEQLRNGETLDNTNNTETHQPQNLSDAHKQQNYAEAMPPLEQYDGPTLKQHDQNGQAFLHHDESEQPLQQHDENEQPLQIYAENEQPLQQYDDSEQPSHAPNQNEQPLQPYDESGQPLHIYNNNEQPLQQYDESGQQIQMYNENQQQLQYDENGQPVPQYDANGDLLQQYQEHQQLQQYDENGQLLQQYDENGQPIQYYAGDPSTTQYYNQTGEFPQYDENGQVLQQYDENGQPIQQYYNNDVMQYDENGQPVLQYDENGQPLNYDPNTQAFLGYDEDSQIAYDENGQPITQYSPHPIESEQSGANQYHEEDKTKQLVNEEQETVQHLQEDQVVNAENTHQETKTSTDTGDKRSDE